MERTALARDGRERIASCAREMSTRLASIDRLRGAAMVLMAIDHVRVYAGVPTFGPPGVFFTRWVTHFCAPAFFFLAGTSAYLHAQRNPGFARFLVTRGLWLVLLELTVLRFFWSFNLELGHLLAGVIWCLGLCMIALAGIARLPLAAVVAFGVVVVAGHDALDVGSIAGGLGDDARSALVKLLYVGFWAGPIDLGGGNSLRVLYSLVPWVGVMALGFAFGSVFDLEPARRDRRCLGIGLGALALFLVLRGLDLYGDPQPWRGQEGMPALLAFLNTSKYPASLCFLLMTLGPSIALLPLLERARGFVADWLTVFGRVPFFFYLLHIPLIHGLAIVVSKLHQGEVSPWLFADHPMGAPPVPEGYVWSLPLLYGIWLVAVLLLALPCRWFADLKARRRDPWLSYL
jgi:uncharacterized membrane protein